jgi:hypothetical protein
MAGPIGTQLYEGTKAPPGLSRDQTGNETVPAITLDLPTVR